jgi:hypothetical protein
VAGLWLGAVRMGAKGSKSNSHSRKFVAYQQVGAFTARPIIWPAEHEDHQRWHYQSCSHSNVRSSAKQVSPRTAVIPASVGPVISSVACTTTTTKSDTFNSTPDNVSNSTDKTNTVASRMESTSLIESAYEKDKNPTALASDFTFAFSSYLDILLYVCVVYYLFSLFYDPLGFSDANVNNNCSVHAGGCLIL